jgi:hypothetical protein
MLVLAIFFVGIIAGCVYQHLQTGFFYKHHETESFPFFGYNVKLTHCSESIGFPFRNTETSVITIQEGHWDPIILYKAKRLGRESFPAVKDVSIAGDLIKWQDGINKYQLTVDLRRKPDTSPSDTAPISLP